MEITKELIEESNIHATINRICKNKFIERSRPEVFEKIKELKLFWKNKLKETEDEEQNYKQYEDHTTAGLTSSKQCRSFELPGRSVWADKRLMERITEHVGEKSRASAIESMMRLLYCEDARLKLEEKKSKFAYSMRSVLDLAMKLESGTRVLPSHLLAQPQTQRLRQRLQRETHVLEEKYRPQDRAVRGIDSTG